MYKDLIILMDINILNESMLYMVVAVLILRYYNSKLPPPQKKTTNQKNPQKTKTTCYRETWNLLSYIDNYVKIFLCS